MPQTSLFLSTQLPRVSLRMAGPLHACQRSGAHQLFCLQGVLLHRLVMTWALQVDLLLQALAAHDGPSHGPTTMQASFAGDPHDIFEHLPRELRITIDEAEGPHTYTCPVRPCLQRSAPIRPFRQLSLHLS